MTREVLPTQPGSELSTAQKLMESDSIIRAQKSARNILISNVALLASFTATKEFLEPPYFMTALLWVSLSMCVISAVLSGITIYHLERLHNGLDLSGRKQDRTISNKNEAVYVICLCIAFISLTLFIGQNLFISLKNDRKVVDIVASNYVVPPGDLVILTANDIEGQEYLWAASDGRLLDTDERSVPWIAPTEVESTRHEVKIEVCVRHNHLYSCSNELLLVGSPLLDSRIDRANFKALDYSCEASLSTSKNSTSELVTAVDYRFWQTITVDQPILIPETDIPCCSTRTIKINCRWDC